MTESRKTAGLDQLGPTHPNRSGVSIDEFRAVHARRRDGANHSINERAAISTAIRKVKITLPRVSCLEQPEAK